MAVLVNRWAGKFIRLINYSIRCGETLHFKGGNVEDDLVAMFVARL